MRSLLRVFFAAMLTIAFAIPALAENKQVPANKSSVILYFVVYDPVTCAYGSKPKTRINLEPAHGKIRFEWFAYKMSKDTRNCAGKFARGMLAIYTPFKGYHGPDEAKVSLIGSGVYPGAGYSLSRSFHYDITVK
jgi:hypothetical protein